MKKRRIGLLTGGGDVPPLNAVIEAVRKKCVENNFELVGFMEGWEGIIKNNYLGLNNPESCVKR